MTSFHVRTNTLICVAFGYAFVMSFSMSMAFERHIPLGHHLLFALLCGISTALAEYVHGKGFFRGNFGYVLYGLTISSLVVCFSMMLSEELIKHEWMEDFVLIALFAFGMRRGIQKSLIKQEMKRREINSTTQQS